MDKIGTYENCKTSLSCFDDKRYILYDSINSLSKKCSWWLTYTISYIKVILFVLFYSYINFHFSSSFSSFFTDLYILYSYSDFLKQFVYVAFFV